MDLYPQTLQDRRPDKNIEKANSYHFDEDISEQNDLAPTMPQKVENLQQRWNDWNATLPEPHWRPRPIE